VRPNAKDPKSTLDRAIAAVRIDEPSPETVAASRTRVEGRLFGGSEEKLDSVPIRSCEDVQSHLAAYRRSGLTAPRALLVRNHLAECARCREVYNRRGTLRLATAPWQRAAESNFVPRWEGKRAFAVLAAAVVLCVVAVMLRTAFFGVPAGQRATVQVVSGALYRLEGSRAEQLAPGAILFEGQVVRAGASAQSQLLLADGSRVELGERAEFSISMRGHDTTLHLHRGQVIVQAAKRTSGHLYVGTRDCRVAVTGTAFSVMSSLKGSRVSVIDGEVHVAQSGQERVLHRGDQVTTNQALARVPIEREIGWSRNLDEHLALLHEMAVLRQLWERVPLPDLRYQGRLLALMPDRTAVYAALPNYGDALVEGSALLKARLAESEVLRRWWQESELGKDGERLDGLVAKIHDLAAYLADEVVIALSQSEVGAQPVVLAEVRKPGLLEFVGAEVKRLGGGTMPLAIVDEQGAATGALPAPGFKGIVLLVTSRFVALSPAPAAIAEIASRLKTNTSSAFAVTPLGERVSQAYEHGVSLIVCADLDLLASVSALAGSPGEIGSGPRYLQFERKEVFGQTLNSGVLAFPAERHGVASWLAAPAPMGSLDFLTPQASAVAAFVAKRPAEVLDDILHLGPGANQAQAKLAKLEVELDLRVREDFAAALGGEVAVALDGPLLPQPAWKLVVEAADAERLERAIEAMVHRADQELQKRREGSLLIEHERVGAHTYHRIGSKGTKIPVEADYALIDGYLVVTPTRPLLTRALDAHASGANLARSNRFTSLLPRDGRADFSGLLFQDLMSILAPAVGAVEVALTPEQNQMLEKLFSQSRPSLMGFYAERDRVEMVSVGDLFGLGPEALALPQMIRRTFPLMTNAGKP
jgi:hypothetical protein